MFTNLALESWSGQKEIVDSLTIFCAVSLLDFKLLGDVVRDWSVGGLSFELAISVSRRLCCLE